MTVEEYSNGKGTRKGIIDTKEKVTASISFNAITGVVKASEKANNEAEIMKSNTSFVKE